MSETQNPTVALLLISLLLLTMPISEIVALFLTPDGEGSIYVAVGIFFIFCILVVGLLFRSRVARAVSIFWLALVGIWSIIKLALPIFLLFPLRYATPEVILEIGLSLFYTIGVFAAAAWLSGRSGRKYFDVSW